MPEPTTSFEDWIAQLAITLELEPDSVDIPLLLDLAREAAHGIARPAAPLTTFMVGLAAGRAGGAGADTRAAVQATRLRMESL